MMNMNKKGMLLVGLLGLIGLGACDSVEPGQVGVEICMSEMQPGVRPSGFYFTGVRCDITPMSTQTQSYTMAGAGAEALTTGSVNVLTKDQLPVALDVTVQFHLNGERAREVYTVFGAHYDDNIVHTQVRTSVRDAASGFTAMELVDDRQRLSVEMSRLVREGLANTLRGRRVNADAVIVDNVLIRNIDLPTSLDQAIAQRQAEVQETQRRQQAVLTAAQEQIRVRTQAETAAQDLLIRTRADAEALRIRSEAQANANRTLALSLTPEVLRSQQIEATRAVLSSNGTRTVFVPNNQLLFTTGVTQ